MKVQILYHYSPTCAAAPSPEHNDEISGIFSPRVGIPFPPNTSKETTLTIEGKGDAYAQYQRTIANWEANADLDSSHASDVQSSDEPTVNKTPRSLHCVSSHKLPFIDWASQVMELDQRLKTW